jgi:hypothetical protein
MVHAIGCGCLLLEVQEPTDFTIQPERWCGEYKLSDREMYLGLDREKALECFDMGKKYPPHDAAKLKFAKGLFGFGDKAVSKAVVPASVNENVEFVAEPLAEEPQFEEQVETPEVQNVEEYVQESADQVVDAQDYVQDTEKQEYADVDDNTDNQVKEED